MSPLITKDFLVAQYHVDGLRMFLILVFFSVFFFGEGGMGSLESVKVWSDCKVEVKEEWIERTTVA